MHFTDDTHCKPAIFDRLLKAINFRHYPTAAGEMIVTSSIGVCIFRKIDVPVSLDEILKLADKKLYAAKAAGRNCFKH